MVMVFLGTVVLRPYRELRPLLHLLLLAVAGLISIIAGLVQVGRGLAPLARLRARLVDVRDGRERRVVDGNYPAEVQPLVDDLNTLLEQRERAVERASAKAGDLAHGLKTPLAVLNEEASRAHEDGHHDLAMNIQQQVARMRRQVDYHLAHARAAASGPRAGGPSPVLASAEGLVRTLKRLYAGRHLVFEVDAPADQMVRVDRDDLEEMLGNLLDNACKWAGARVSLTSTTDRGSTVIFVDDDGRGLEKAMREKVLQRGVRADETAPGSGLGLAIVQDLAELNGGSIALDDSPLGGVRARLTFPQSSV
jgi:signal transduction histidine kinase